jgi:hypothetical protein
LDSEGSGDYDDEYDYDDEDLDVSSGGKVASKVGDDKTDDNDDSLEKIVDDIEEKELEADEDEDDDDDVADDVDATTTTTVSTSTLKDDIHFVEEDDTEVEIEQEKTKVRKPASNANSNTKKDDLLYEYYSEYLDEDYDDLNDNDSADVKKTPKLPPVVAVPTTPKTIDVADTTDASDAEKSAIFPPSYIFLIIASALVSFTVFMLAFLVCRRTVAQRRQKKLMPFVVSASSYGPPSLSTTVKSSGPIVKNYQRVPTSTKEFLYQQQQQQQQLADQLQGETKEPLLT